ncbi:INTU family protein [Megaselia abdita]
MEHVDDWLKTPVFSSSLSSFSTENSSVNSDHTNWENYVESDGSLFYAEYEHFDEKPRNVKSKTLECDLKSFKLSDVTSSGIIEVELIITSEDRYRFGRRSSPFEAILGFNVRPFSDNNSCLMVSGMVTNSTIDKMNLITIGSWFKQINDIDIRIDNLDDVLMQFSTPTNVVLKFQGVKSTDNFDGFNKVVSLRHFQNNFEDILKCGNHSDEPPFFFIAEPLNSNSTGDIFFYPKQQLNLFSKAKGCFITLNSILNNEFKSQPLYTVIKCDGVVYYVNYKVMKSFLLLLIFSEKQCNRKESFVRSTEFFSFLNMNFKDTFDFEYLTQICRIVTSSFYTNLQSKEFHDFLKELPYLPLPKEAQLRVLDACSELEAMDYRIWNSAPLNSHREFFIVGHVLYQKSSLISYNVIQEQLHYIHMHLKYNGIFDFIESVSCKMLITWNVMPLANDTYLTICGKNNLLFAIVLKSYVPKNEVNSTLIKPSLFYIEEIEDTLDHLIQSGIGSLSNAWVDCNKRPEIKMFDKKPCKKKIVDTTHLEKEEYSNSDSDEDWKDFPHSKSNTDVFNFKEVEKMVPLKLTSSKCNDMLKYLSLNNVKLTSNLNSSQFQNIADKYFQFLHNIIQCSRKARQENNALSNKALSSVKEFGIVVKIEKDKTVAFTGRLFPSPFRELYVAYLSEHPQNLVELEYRIASLVAG